MAHGEGRHRCVTSTGRDIVPPEHLVTEKQALEKKKNPLVEEETQAVDEERFDQICFTYPSGKKSTENIFEEEDLS